MHGLFIVSGNMGSDFKHLLTFFSDPENSGVQFLEDENRLEIAEGYVHVALGGLLSYGPDDRKIAEIYANTLAYYQGFGQQRLFIVCGNKDNPTDRLVSELNNFYIKNAILNNDPARSDPTKMTFAEYIVALLYWQQDHGRPIKFLDTSKFHAIKKLVHMGESLVHRLKSLTLKENRSAKETDELVAKNIEFIRQIKYKVDGGKRAQIRLRKLIWRLASKGMLIEGSRLEWDGQDAKGNYDNILLLYLRWILPENVFELRRAELGVENAEDISDAQVMENMIVDAIMPYGNYRTMVESSIAAMSYNDTLFVPGGLNADSMIVANIDYSQQSIDDWINAVNQQFKNAQKLRYSGDLRVGKILEQDTCGSTNANFGSIIPQVVINFLKLNNITRVLVGRDQNPLTVLGRQFVQDGITFACLDFNRSDQTKRPMCYAKIDETSLVIRTHVHLPDPQAISISEVLEPVEIANNDLGFYAGEYTRVITPVRDMLYACGNVVEMISEHLRPEVENVSKPVLSI